ncbi:helix-turn-helix domain-containing protein [Paenibacillus sp. IITD108]|uniref:helix-turn-helix domain-containing protein n=1 Tax=Paenibacillus sp. IITD108 TaxID=3116649 RepID=UPI002F3EFC69
MVYEKLGKRIREERLKLNLTQEKLAEKVDVSEAYIGQIERGERSMSLDTLIKLSNKLGVTVDFLLSDSVDFKEDQFLGQLRQIMLNRSTNEKQMTLDIIKVMFSHLDNSRLR